MGCKPKMNKSGKERGPAIKRRTTKKAAKGKAGKENGPAVKRRGKKK